LRKFGIALAGTAIDGGRQNSVPSFIHSIRYGYAGAWKCERVEGPAAFPGDGRKAAERFAKAHLVADAPPDYDEAMDAVPRSSPRLSLALIVAGSIAAWALVIFALKIAYEPPPPAHASPLTGAIVVQR
jgi:hypothetical protein